MPRATARSSARRWGSRFDVISGPQLTDSSSLASDDAMTTSMTGASTTKTTEKASSESGFGDEPSSAASQLTATTATAANRSVLSDPNSASEGDAFSWGDEPHEASTPWGDNPPRPYPSANHNAPENLKPFNIMHSSPTQHHPTFSPSASLPARRLQRWNHNASVFVASLPPEPNAELDNYLRESLGKHGNILNIKFIHDVRSGNASNCAFVQFEHPHEAANAIQACHMTFIRGRVIRCEPAKAHRTLLISFCPPPTPTPLGTFKNIDPRTGIDPADKSPEWVRIRRPDPRTHFIYVTFNKVASEYVDTQPSYWTDESDPLSGPGALVSLTHEVPKAETMRILVKLFGPLEIFRPFMIPLPEEVQGHPYAPHPIRAESDDPSTYEVKWEQRQDAISALYCLNRIPNLVVTWAHEHPHPANYRDSFSRVHGMSSSNFPPRDELTNTQSHPAPSTPSRSEVVHRRPTGTPVAGVQRPDYERTPVNMVKNIASPMPYNKVAAMVSQTPIHPRSSHDNVRNTPASEDFPPLPGAITDEREGAAVHAAGTGGTSKYENEQDRVSVTSPYAVLPEVDASDISEASMDGGEGAINISTEVAPALSLRESVTPPSTMAPLSDQVESEQAHSSVAGMDTPDVAPLSPETPSLIHHSPSRSPTSVDITPSSSVMPITPSPLLRSSRPLAQQSVEFANYKERVAAEKAAATQEQQGIHTNVDGAPVTDSIFVGGLDLSYGWTEDKIKDTFSVYGKILGVRLIFKNLDYVGHSFIKFAKPSDMAKAIAGENGRTYGGRSLRVNYSNMYSRARISHTARRHVGGGPAQGLGLQGVALQHNVYGTPTEAEDVFSSNYGAPVIANIETKDMPTHTSAAASSETGLSSPLTPKSPPTAPSFNSTTVASSDSAPAALGLISPNRPSNPKSGAQQFPAPVPVPDAKIARNETAPLSTLQKDLTLQNSGSLRSIPQTPASSNTGGAQRRRTHARAHSDPATPSSADHAAINADRLVPHVTEPQPNYPHSQEMYLPYAPIFYVHPSQAQLPAGAIAFPNFANNPHRPNWRQPWYPPVISTFFPQLPTSVASSLPSGPQHSFQPTGFVHHGTGALLPVYGNDALDPYVSTSWGTPASELTSPTASVSANPTSWPAMPTFPPWLPQQLMVSPAPHAPPAAMLQSLAMLPSSGDWNASSSPSAPHSQSHPQPSSPPAVQFSQFPHHAQNPFLPTPFPMQPSGANHQTSSVLAPMSTHGRSRPHGGKRIPSHGGEGIQIHTQTGKSNKHGNESRPRQQHQQYADEGSVHFHHPQHARQPNTGGHPGPAGQATPIFPYAAYPFPFDPNANPGSVGHPIPNQNSHSPQKANVQTPAQWNMVPAAYDNP